MNAAGILAALSDAGTSNSDASYGGVTGEEGVFDAQYYRNKADDFQRVMNSLDTTAQNVRVILQSGVTEETADELQEWLAEFDSKRTLFRLTAQAINAGASMVNAAGGRFPVLQIPQSLGFAPALPIAAVAAIAAAATLISWGKNWMAGINQRMREKNLLAEIDDPAQRAVAARAMLDSQQAQAAAEASPLATIATIAKWGAIGWLAYLGWKTWSNR